MMKYVYFISNFVIFCNFELCLGQFLMKPMVGGENETSMFTYSSRTYLQSAEVHDTDTAWASRHGFFLQGAHSVAKMTGVK